MSFIDKILSVITPYECLVCGVEGDLACPDCLNEFLIKYQECYRCRRPSSDSLTCGDCVERSALYRAAAVVYYQDLPKDLVWRLKSAGAQAAATTMARCMLPWLAPDIELIIPAPTASRRVRQRGYDQSRLLARQLSKLSGIPWASGLLRSGQAHQVGADKDHRLRQLETAFTAQNISLLQNARIVLVDDVITTGATIESAARTLRQAGAARVEALAFARPALQASPINSLNQKSA
jgi:ComF family protein